MPAKIYRPAKTAMQSGKAKTHLWVLEFDQESPRKIDPIMRSPRTRDSRLDAREVELDHFAVIDLAFLRHAVHALSLVIRLHERHDIAPARHAQELA